MYAPSREASLSLVIPVFNNKDSLAPLVQRVTEAFKSFSQIQIDFLFIDDGSSDDSWNEILRIKENSTLQVHGVKFTRNFGQVNAIISGLEIAQGDFIAVMSADLQDPPELLPKLVELLLKGNEIVIGHRESRDESPLRRVTSNLAYAIARRSYSNMPQGGFDYFAVTSRVGRLFLGLPGRHRFIQGDLLWLGIPITVVPYSREKRVFGKSGWTLSKRWKYFIDIALDGSYFPIKAMSLIGLTIASISMLYALLIIFTRYFGQTPFPGWAPIMISILFVGGLIMMMLGVVGEYIWRIYDEVRAKPKYVIDKII